MKKFLSYFCSLLLFTNMIYCPAAAYHFMEDPVSDSYEYQFMALVKQYAFDSADTLPSSAYRFSAEGLDDAVRLYTLSPDEFLTLCRNGSFGLLEIDNNYSWEIPIYMDEETGAYQCVSFGYLDNGTFDYIISTASTNDFGADDYLFYPEQAVEALYRAGASEDADIYLVSVTDIHLKLVVAEEKGVFWVVPYASRPDFLKLKNGTAMTLEGVADKVETYLNENSPASTWGIAAGGGVGPSGHLPLGLAGIAFLCITVFIFCCFKKRHSLSQEE